MYVQSCIYTIYKKYIISSFNSQSIYFSMCLQMLHAHCQYMFHVTNSYIHYWYIYPVQLHIKRRFCQLSYLTLDREIQHGFKMAIICINYASILTILLVSNPTVLSYRNVLYTRNFHLSGALPLVQNIYLKEYKDCRSIRCAWNCLMEGKCMGIIFKTEEKVCRLLQYPLSDSLSLDRNPGNAGWKYYAAPTGQQITCTILVIVQVNLNNNHN